MTYSAVTKRRLRDGAKGMSVGVMDLQESSVEDLQRKYSSLSDSIVALQSLDDLGSPEANQEAWDDMIELSKRCKAVEEELERRGVEPKWT